MRIARIGCPGYTRPVQARLSAATERPAPRAAADLEAPAQFLAGVPKKSPKKPAQRRPDLGLASSPRLVAEDQRRSSLFGTLTEPAQRKRNPTGLPDNLKTGVESFSGVSLDNVKVHYNSARPAQLNALAYAQGSDIHVAPGQARHLPHEAWHVVQQAQGRVQPTMQMKDGVPVNDDAGLEHEADVMGAKAAGRGDLAVPSRLFEGRAERAEADLQRQPIRGRGAKGPLNFLSSRASVVQRILTQEEFDQVQELARDIMRTYPPDRYHYLGLGKSPTAVMAFLQEYGSRANISATNMPLSKFGHSVSSMSRAESKVAEGAPLNAEQRQRLWDHFDRFVPTVSDLEGKDILLIDLVQSGKSLVATQRHLEQYLSERYHGTGATGMMFSLLSTLSCFPEAPKVAALPLAIAEQQVGGTKKVMDSMGLTAKAMMIPGNLDTNTSLAARMGGEDYKPQAEYPDDFKISAPNKPKTNNIKRDPRGEYAKLRNEFARFLTYNAPVVGLMEGGEALSRVERNEQATERLLMEDE